jgi:DNA polymerase III subunit epsilon
MRLRAAPHGPGAAAYRSARLPAGRTPWREARYCAVDLELSGLDPKRHEIVSFGAVPIEDGRVQLGGAVHGRVRPLREISESSIRVHGLRAADLADAPALDEAIDTSVLGLVWLHEHYGGGPRHLPLSNLSQTLGLPSHHPHDAFGDALTTAQVFLALATHLDALRPQTVRRLSTADRRLDALLTYPSR